MRNFINIIESFQIPTIWYHSTESDPVMVAQDFENNNIDPTGAVSKFDTQYWFSDSWDASRYYGENTIIAKLHFKNPRIVTPKEYASDNYGPVSWARRAVNDGYDAIIIEDIMDGDMFSTVCAVFDHNIIDAKPYSKWNDDTQSFDML